MTLGPKAEYLNCVLIQTNHVTLRTDKKYKCYSLIILSGYKPDAFNRFKWPNFVGTLESAWAIPLFSSKGQDSVNGPGNDTVNGMIVFPSNAVGSPALSSPARTPTGVERKQKTT